MSVRASRAFGALIALTALVYACSGGSGQSPTPSLGSGSDPGQLTNFRAATSAEKGEVRPSLSVGSRVPATDSRGKPGYYTLVTSLTTNDKLDFSEWTSRCDPDIFRAPWYVSLRNLSLTVPTTTLAVCSSSSATATPSPTPTPTVTPEPVSSSFSVTRASSSQAAGLYIVKIDIGFLDLSVDTLSGPATTANGEWTFYPDESTTNFQFGHFYAFFVAQWNAGSAPTASPSPTPTPTSASF
ncbi:MAG TPA: hypothetical protein VMF11_00285 [Candidatus Baltobacteraceae bacterium]|nr:hypothetical protein [Candidatus Baltobacteraceae bacterium]